MTRLRSPPRCSSRTSARGSGRKPAAALYTPAMLRTLEEDFARLSELLAAPVAAAALPGTAQLAETAPPPEPEALQLGLF